jgi:porphobilinogen deaminase
MNEALAVGIPTFVVLLGILWNHTEIRDLRGDVNSRLDRIERNVNSRLDRIEADLRQFYHELGRHEGEIDALKGRK